ncbi:hypothetical protein [Streptomyces sp. NBC_01716]|uniref:hypothetical protein n=1 Tax=Streptomyces sp. NBC_01716 TaxID=2975917 RepID=UPI002E3582BC|nr:hypothetical protein [Streptomyces sp. NBC_01716]
MRVVRVLATAALSSLALGVGATAVHADPQPTLTVSPSPARPGSPVTLSLNGGCDASTVTASSGAFTGSVTLTASSTTGIYRGTATIRRDARAGTHTVNISCPNGSPSTFTFTVARSSTPSPTPTRGARGGLGGSVSGMDATKVAAGAGLVTLAAAGGTLALRRRAKH